ncbi:MAG: LCP family protein [Ileibacterium sp.]|nr:LCP family protein [Ileibacterium sp.]
MPTKKTESNHRRAFTPNKRLFFLISGLVLIGIALTIGFVLIQNWEEAKSASIVAGKYGSSNADEPDLVYEGVGYNLKDNIETTLIMGIDKFEDTGEKDEKVSRNPSQCDFLTLLVTDKTTGNSRMIQLNRDTMVDVDVLGFFNDVISTDKMQLALAHSYGSGDRDSARNAMRSVSRLFSNVPIDHFVALTMDAVANLNDAIGGVPVLVEEDFSKVDPSLVMGETITLKGDQSLHYVRGRTGVDNGTNEERMARQQKYMNSFYKTLAKAMDEGKVSMTKLLTDVSPYMTSDLSVNGLNDVLTTAMEHSQPNIEVLQGTAKMGAKYVEFYPDQDALMEETISLFFEPAPSSPQPGQSPNSPDIQAINNPDSQNTENNK